MLQRMHDKLNAQNLDDRCALIKGDLVATLSRLPDRCFDGCILLNVLFALDNPTEALRQVRRVLSDDGTLTLSTSREETSIERLFMNIYEQHEGKNEDEFEKQWQAAYERNKEMNDMITRYSLADIKSFLRKAGFKIVNFDNGHYENCVVVVEAQKQMRYTLRRPGSDSKRESPTLA